MINEAISLFKISLDDSLPIKQDAISTEFAVDLSPAKERVQDQVQQIQVEIFIAYELKMILNEEIDMIKSHRNFPKEYVEVNGELIKKLRNECTHKSGLTHTTCTYF